MRNKNRVEIRGFLGAEPKLGKTESGRSYATLSICTNYEYTTKDGESVTRPEWHRVVVWGKTAENAAKYLAKGSEAEVEGRLSTRQYESKGETRYVTEIVAEQINYGRRANATPVVAASAPVVKRTQQTTVRRKSSAAPEVPTFDDGDVF